MIVAGCLSFIFGLRNGSAIVGEVDPTKGPLNRLGLFSDFGD